MITSGIFIAIGVAFIISGTYFYCTYKGQRTYKDNEIPRIRQGIV